MRRPGDLIPSHMPRGCVPCMQMSRRSPEGSLLVGQKEVGDLRTRDDGMHESDEMLCSVGSFLSRERAERCLPSKVDDPQCREGCRHLQMLERAHVIEFPAMCHAGWRNECQCAYVTTGIESNRAPYEVVADSGGVTMLSDRQDPPTEKETTRTLMFRLTGVCRGRFRRFELSWEWSLFFLSPRNSEMAPG